MAPRKVRIWDGTIVEFVPSQPPACSGVGGVTHSAEGYGVRRTSALNLQRELCASCPVLRECMSHALNNEPHGLWGLTEHQRRDLGGVTSEEWARYTPNPALALEEIAQSGIEVQMVREVLDEQRIRVPVARRRPAA